MAEVIYLCSEEHHNKYWSYSINGTSVTIKWGRVGGKGTSQVKNFNSDYDLQQFIADKIEEKEGKGYKAASQQKLKEEVSTAKTLGLQNKIHRMLWMSRKGNDLAQLDAYDPKQFVYVEVLNSWSKEMTRLLLAKDETWMVAGGISEYERNISVNGMNHLDPSHAFSRAVRDILKRMSQVVAEVMKTVKFAAVGSRSLFDDSVVEAPDVQMALSQIDSSGFEKSVISKFASMGSRMLEL